MQYQNAREVLPDWLVDALQEYAQGAVLYVPRKSDVRTGWGQANGAREHYTQRNNNILRQYRQGASMEALSLQYHLSIYSIRKIISLSREQECSEEELAPDGTQG